MFYIIVCYIVSASVKRLKVFQSALEKRNCLVCETKRSSKVQLWELSLHFVCSWSCLSVIQVTFASSYSNYVLINPNFQLY